MNPERPEPFLRLETALIKPALRSGARTRFSWMIVLGVTLFLGTAGLAIRSPDVMHLIPFTLAVLASLGCLFFKAYRGIFFGFYVTLGVIILAFILFYFIVDAIHLYPTHSPRAGI